MDKHYDFAKRATVRQYTDSQISDTEIAEMLEAASHAPNTGNMQWYSVVVTRDERQKAALAPTHFNQPQVGQASAVLTFCIDLRRFEAWCRQSGAEPGYDNFQSFVAAMIDTSIFAQQFCTLAEIRGYGTCYLGTTTYNAAKIASVLGLPERVVPVTTVTVGCPAGETQPSFRLPVEAIMHSEKYSDASAEKIAEWYAPLEAESAHFVVENGKQSLAQVFTDVRYAKDANEFFSKEYLDVLKANRFI